MWLPRLRDFGDVGFLFKFESSDLAYRTASGVCRSLEDGSHLQESRAQRFDLFTKKRYLTGSVCDDLVRSAFSILFDLVTSRFCRVDDGTSLLFRLFEDLVRGPACIGCAFDNVTARSSASLMMSAAEESAAATMDRRSSSARSRASSAAVVTSSARLTISVARCSAALTIPAAREREAVIRVWLSCSAVSRISLAMRVPPARICSRSRVVVSGNGRVLETLSRVMSSSCFAHSRSRSARSQSPARLLMKARTSSRSKPRRRDRNVTSAAVEPARDSFRSADSRESRVSSSIVSMDEDVSSGVPSGPSRTGRKRLGRIQSACLPRIKGWW